MPLPINNLKCYTSRFTLMLEICQFQREISISSEVFIAFSPFPCIILQNKYSQPIHPQKEYQCVAFSVYCEFQAIKDIIKTLHKKKAQTEAASIHNPCLFRTYNYCVYSVHEITVACDLGTILFRIHTKKHLYQTIPTFMGWQLLASLMWPPDGRITANITENSHFYKRSQEITIILILRTFQLMVLKYKLLEDKES